MLFAPPHIARRTPIKGANWRRDFDTIKRAAGFGPKTEDKTKPQLKPRVEDSCTKPVVVFDEIHQLHDPTRLLKIGADVFPKLRILATGSSTFAASRKFRDTLTGRKRTVHLVPVTLDELPAFAHPVQREDSHIGASHVIPKHIPK